MTTTPAAPPRQYDEKATGLRVLLAALDDLGLSDTLTETRSLLARAAEIEAACWRDLAANRTELDGLVAKVADGALALDRLVVRSAELAPWVPAGTLAETATAAWAVTGRVTAELRDRAHRAAVASRLDVHGALSKMAATAVKRGVEGGQRLVDVTAVCVALRPPAGLRVNRGPLGGDPFRGYVPPPLPEVTLASVQADAAAVTAWAAATAAVQEWRRCHEVAGILHKVVGGRSTGFAGTVDSYQHGRIGSELPEQVHLAVTDALGWRPGLWLDLKPRAPRPPDTGRDNRSWTTPVTKVGPNGLAGVL